MPERCIGCGSCLDACSPNAIEYRSEMDEVKFLLQSGKEVVAITGPSISGEFEDITDYRKFVRMIKELGFKYVHESSFGVDLVAHEYASLLKNFRGKYYITTCCPVVVSYVEKFCPDLTGNLMPFISPMIASTQVVRKKYGLDVKIVYIGPCIANKNEARLYEGEKRVDAVLTFLELRALFKEFNISESSLEFSDFNLPHGYKGSLYPISNGILQAGDINEDLLQGKIITAQGKGSMMSAIREFDTNIAGINCNFNLWYCKGCIMGPGTSRNGNRYYRRSLVINYVNKRLHDFNFSAWEQAVKEYSDIDFQRGFATDDQRLPIPDEETIANILRQLDVDSPEDETGCTACGYESCREFAIAIAQGLATGDMCNSLSQKNKQNYIQTLKLTNDQLVQTQDALRESEKHAREEQDAAKEASGIVTTMLQKIPNAVVIVDNNLKILQSNDSFIELIGDEAREINSIIPGLAGADLKTLMPHVFYNMISFVLSSSEEIINRDLNIGEKLFNISIFAIKKNQIVGALVRDLSDPEVQKEEVVNRVSDVINKNLELVQKIGFILGEGAAETERMLNSIIETYKSTGRK
jgi:Na+-translocating ferredoxin:NAD+ oxidoreductase RNF subunit RnfB